jgi:hypothetical protein
VEPVGNGHRGDRPVDERDRLGHTLAHAVGSDRPGQALAERGLRLDGDHVEACCEQRAAELLRSGGQV